MSTRRTTSTNITEGETPIAATTAWTNDELSTIGAAEELEIAPTRQDGTLRNPVTIWVVRHGDDQYVRSVNGRSAAWFRAAQVRHEAHTTPVASTKSFASTRRTS